MIFTPGAHALRIFKFHCSLCYQRRSNPRFSQKEHLGITAGEELPRRGRCRHYSKSVRFTYSIHLLRPADGPCSIAGSGMEAANKLGGVKSRRGKMLTDAFTQGSHAAIRCFHVTGASNLDALVMASNARAANHNRVLTELQVSRRGFGTLERSRKQNDLVSSWHFVMPLAPFFVTMVEAGSASHWPPALTKFPAF